LLFDFSFAYYSLTIAYQYWKSIELGSSRRLSMQRTGSVLCLLVMALAISVSAQTSQSKSKLGTIDFPTSGSPQAQQHFLRGIAALHSFWYEEALEAFQTATRTDPHFAMGYWGEAMTYNHPLWAQQDTEAARKALAKIKDTGKLSAKEKALIDAIRVLYSEGDKLARDFAYAAAMEKIYRDYPDDLEAAAFYSLALLGTVRPGDKGFQRQMKAGAIAMDIYRKNPDHPGAAHYIIHSFDDPEHAILALPAARRYAEIAPDAHHARHMPSHIFLQLGMWPEAASSNESAWAVSDEWVKRKNLALNLRDYHSYHWLTYVYSQQGRFEKAEELINRLRQTMREHGRESVRWYDDLVSAFIIDAQRWNSAEKLFEKPDGKGAAEAGDHAGHGSHGGGSTAAPKPATSMVPGSRRGMSLPLFVQAYAAASSSAPGAEELLNKMRAERRQSGDAYSGKMLEIRELEIDALIKSSKNNFDEAIASMKKAAALEEEMSPPSGPPTLIKPSHELFGEILLRANRPKDAVKQFEVALSRQPNRARALIGLARAAARSGDKPGAVAAYTNFLRVWQHADSGLPELSEARGFLGQAGLK
jgi:tetratricopeptide (TPR) repeat protein